MRRFKDLIAASYSAIESADTLFCNSLTVNENNADSEDKLARKLTQ